MLAVLAGRNNRSRSPDTHDVSLARRQGRADGRSARARVLGSPQRPEPPAADRSFVGMPRRSGHRILLALLLAAASIASLPASATAASCDGPAADATLCMLNGERTDRGLAPLRPNAKLTGVATAYAQDLVTGSYFSHTGRDGSSAFDRIERSGYIPRFAGWVVGENLAWGTGELATPGAIMTAWMNSPGHRENILNPEFREIGIGVVAGNPAAADGLGATYATEFGVIDRPDSARRRSASAARERRRARRRARARQRRQRSRRL